MKEKTENGGKTISVSNKRKQTVPVLTFYATSITKSPLV